MYYNDNKKKVNVLTNELIGSGIFSSVYKMDEYAYKIFNNIVKLDKNGLKKSEKVLRLICDSHLDNMYEIKDFLFDDKGKKNFSGYVSLYYDGMDIKDFLNIPMDYILENYYDLVKLCGALANRYIAISDLHEENIILGDKIIVIDADNYIMLNEGVYSIKEIYLRNLSQILNLVPRILKFKVKCPEGMEKFEFRINCLESFYNADIKKLSKYKNYGEYLSNYM